MRTIGGFAVLGEGRLGQARLVRECWRSLLEQVCPSADFFGLVAVDRDGRIHERHAASLPAADEVEELATADVSAVLVCAGAAPPARWPEARLPPFTAAGWAVSNDAAVGEGREDGAILPHLFARLGFEVGLAHLSTPRTRLRGDLGVPGSFAVAAVDGSRPRELRLARSYRPLHLMRHPELPAVFFGSTPEQLLPPAPPGELDLCRPRVEALPPHHVAVLDARDGRVRLRPLPEARPAPPRRALVLASGGLRSTVAATMLLRHGFEVTLLRCRTESAAEEREARAAAAVAEALGCELKTLAGPRSRGRLPVGNLPMVASASALADAEAFTHVALGVNGEDGGVGPAGTPEFLAAVDLASRLGTWGRPRVIAPLAGLLGHEVARLGAATAAPLHLSWSCLRGGEAPCGGCAGCARRRAAFERGGLSESLHEVEDLVQARHV